MTEGSIARVQAPSLSSFKLHLPTPGPGGLGCISPPPAPPSPPPAEESGLEVRAEATLRRRPPNSCPSAGQPETHKRTAVTRGSEGSFRGAECNCLDRNFPGPPASPASILSSACFSPSLSRTLSSSFLPLPSPYLSKAQRNHFPNKNDFKFEKNAGPTARGRPRHLGGRL